MFPTMASTESAIASLIAATTASATAAAMTTPPSVGVLSSVTMAAPTLPTLSAPTTPSLSAPDGASSSTSSSGVPMSHAIYSVLIKSLVPYTLDLQSHNYTKWRTLFTIVLGGFNLLHHVEFDDTHPDDIEWTKDNLLVGNWLYSTISKNLLDMCL
jgi:hypothetical protein